MLTGPLNSVTYKCVPFFSPFNFDFLLLEVRGPTTYVLKPGPLLPNGEIQKSCIKLIYENYWSDKKNLGLNTSLLILGLV